MTISQDKKSLKLNPEDHLHAEGFALNVFGKADKQDRAGRADLYGISILLFLSKLMWQMVVTIGGLNKNVALARLLKPLLWILNFVRGYLSRKGKGNL